MIGPHKEIDVNSIGETKAAATVANVATLRYDDIYSIPKLYLELILS